MILGGELIFYAESVIRSMEVKSFTELTLSLSRFVGAAIGCRKPIVRLVLLY